MNVEPEKFDEIIPYENINIIICSTSVMHLLGTEIDWKKTLMGESFHFTNPNAVANCGCGTSFSV
jgi:iron-sulfur cluster assembly protein